jgi:putative ABC transport system permease protein
MSWLARLSNALRPSRVQQEIEREISFHIAERVDELRAAGVSEDEARRRARRQFGHVTLQAERTRDVDVMLWVDALRRNVRYAVRTLMRTPAFTATVVLTLALGIGANTAVFSAINAVLLQPLRFPHGDRLMRIGQTQERSAETAIAPIRLEEWNRLNDTFEAITGYYVEDVSETSGDLPERIRRAWVAPRFLAVWGIAPAIGRGFTDGDYVPGGRLPVLVSDAYWRRRFGSDPGVIGKNIRVGTASFPIVGIMPASFLFQDRQVDLWFPSAIPDALAKVRQATWYTGIGRLKPSVTLDQARANLSIVQEQLAREYPNSDRGIRVNVTPLKEVTVGNVRASLWLLYGAVSVLLIITCTNIAALMLSRAAHRQDEVALRLSLGASRRTVAAQMLTEAVVLSLVGGTIGLLAAGGAAGALRSAAATLPRIEEIRVDTRILLYTLGTTLTVAVACGLLPVLRTGRGRLSTHDAGRTQVSTRNAVQWLLVGTQVALSVTLLAGAGLLARSLQQLSRVDPGFDPSRVLTFRISGTWNETANYDGLLQRIDHTIEQLPALPGVASAATTIFLPGVPATYESTFDLVEAQGDAERRLAAEHRFVSPEYFTTMKISLMGGDLCGRQGARAPKEAMVNRSFASRYLSQRSSVLGLHLSTNQPNSLPARIVGVVGDARERGLDREPAPIVYTCFSAPNPSPFFLVRTHGEPASIAQAVRVKIKSLEPSRAVYDIAALEDRIGAAFSQDRLRAVVLVSFAATALLLACVGLYGTLSYTVTLRRREIGLRLALGAIRGDIVRHFLLQALRVVAAACACGLALSLAFARLLTGMLYGVSPSDPMILTAVIGFVVAVATLAALIPATRAAFVAPMVALREE